MQRDETRHIPNHKRNCAVIDSSSNNQNHDHHLPLYLPFRYLLWGGSTYNFVFCSPSFLFFFKFSILNRICTIYTNTTSVPMCIRYVLDGFSFEYIYFVHAKCSHNRKKNVLFQSLLLGSIGKMQIFYTPQHHNRILLLFGRVLSLSLSIALVLSASIPMLDAETIFGQFCLPFCKHSRYHFLYIRFNSRLLISCNATSCL